MSTARTSSSKHLSPTTEHSLWPTTAVASQRNSVVQVPARGTRSLTDRGIMLVPGWQDNGGWSARDILWKVLQYYLHGTRGVQSVVLHAG